MCGVDGCHLTRMDSNITGKMKDKFNSCSSDITLIITHTASQRAPMRENWTVSEPEVAKPNQIYFGIDTVRR